MSSIITTSVGPSTTATPLNACATPSRSVQIGSANTHNRSPAAEYGPHQNPCHPSQSSPFSLRLHSAADGTVAARPAPHLSGTPGLQNLPGRLQRKPLAAVQNLIAPPSAVSPSTGSKRKRVLVDVVERDSEEMRRRCELYEYEPCVPCRHRKSRRLASCETSESGNSQPQAPQCSAMDVDVPIILVTEAQETDASAPSSKDSGSKVKKVKTPPSDPSGRRVSRRLKQKEELAKAKGLESKVAAAASKSTAVMRGKRQTTGK